MGKNKTDTLRARIIKEVEKERLISTWHWNDFFNDCAEIMEWPLNDLQGNQRRLRYHLNKLVDEGVLKKKRTGSGWCGKNDFGYTSSNSYFLATGIND